MRGRVVPGRLWRGEAKEKRGEKRKAPKVLEFDDPQFYFTLGVDRSRPAQPLARGRHGREKGKEGKKRTGERERKREKERKRERKRERRREREREKAKARESKRKRDNRIAEQRSPPWFPSPTNKTRFLVQFLGLLSSCFYCMLS